MLELNVFGQLETLLSDHLYPFRYLITLLLALGGGAAALIAVRAGAHRVLWRHRFLASGVGIPLLAAGIFVGNYLVSPLWERSFLEEASPLEAAAIIDAPPADASMAMSAMQEGPRTLQAGMFQGADDFHFGRGNALIILTDGGGHVLRFENFSVRNGPDLFVYLSREESGRRVEETLNLGALKATDGAFNYEIPSGLDLTSIKSVVVWCRQFSTLFAVAPLKPN
jgi:hypothetical protein